MNDQPNVTNPLPPDVSQQAAPMPSGEADQNIFQRLFAAMLKKRLQTRLSLNGSRQNPHRRAYTKRYADGRQKQNVRAKPKPNTRRAKQAEK